MATDLTSAELARMDHDVFVSYATSDAGWATDICAGLEKHGIRCWIAPRDEIVGVNFYVQITKAIETARILVLLFSTGANASKDVGQEVSLAYQRDKIVIPVRLEDIPAAPPLSYLLEGVQWLDISPDQRDSLFDELAGHVRCNLGSSSLPAVSCSERPALAERTTNTLEHGDGEPLDPWSLWDLIGRALDDTDFAPTDQAAQVLRIASRNWRGVQDRDPTPEDAETCRLSFLAASILRDRQAQDTWGSRWLARATVTGWTESIGYYLMSAALGRFSLDNHGATTLDAMSASPAAQAILDEVEVILAQGPSSVRPPGGRSPTRAGLQRQLYEKRGLFALATGAYADAQSAFDMALSTQPDSPRTQIKVRLSLALTAYLWGTDNAGAIAETRSQAHAAKRAEFRDLSNQADANIVVMTRGGRDVRPYDIL